MPASASRERIVIAGGVAVAAAAAIVMFARSHWDSLYDDSFIYLRYARNLHAGCGPSFNCDGAYVEGFTGAAVSRRAVAW